MVSGRHQRRRQQRKESIKPAISRSHGSEKWLSENKSSGISIAAAKHGMAWRGDQQESKEHIRKKISENGENIGRKEKASA